MKHLFLRLSYVDRCCTKPPPGDAVVIELDEMWHFLQRKTNKVWIWKAYDRTTGRLVDWECGDRDERTFRRLFDRLARWKVRLFCSDSYVVYALVLAVGRHYQGKRPRQERNRCLGTQQRSATALERRRRALLPMPARRGLSDSASCVRRCLPSATV